MTEVLSSRSCSLGSASFMPPLPLATAAKIARSTAEHHSQEVDILFAEQSRKAGPRFRRAGLVGIRRPGLSPPCRDLFVELHGLLRMFGPGGRPHAPDRFVIWLLDGSRKQSR